MIRRTLVPLALLGVLCVWMGSASASAEQFVPWTEVTFTARAPDAFGKMNVTLETGDDGALSGLKITSEKQGEIDVPAEALKDVPAPRLDEVRTTYEVGYDPEPWFYVRVPYGEVVKLDDGWRHPTMVFAVQDGRVVYRAILTPKAGGGHDWTQEKFS